MRKEVWFGLSIMALVVIVVFVADAGAVADDQRPPRPADARADRRRRSCSAFPTAFTLMGMGVFFALARLPQRQSGDSPIAADRSTSWCSAPTR